MSRFAVSWSIDGRLRAVSLDPGRDHLLGRESDAAIVVPLATVSRRQAMLTSDGSRFLIENLSSTNPTRVGTAVVSGPTPMADGETIDAGGAVLRFHDLAFGDRIGGPACSHCRRENKSGDTECWFCGTSLVNAPTEIRKKRRLACRLVDDAGIGHDVLEGQALSIHPDGHTEALEVDAAPVVGVMPTVSVASGRPVFTPTDDAVVEREGGEATEDAPLVTGDVVRVADHRYVAIVR